MRHFVGHDGPVYRIELIDDDATLVSIGSDGQLRDWEVASGTLRSELQAHDGAAWSVGDKSDTVVETGIFNLTKSETPALLHFGKNKTQTWLLVRLEDPEESGAE